jgi:hypothetical protein
MDDLSYQLEVAGLKRMLVCMCVYVCIVCGSTFRCRRAEHMQSVVPIRSR